MAYRVVQPIDPAYEACSSCGGHGMQDYGGSIGECWQCGGNCFVRARDSRGRFTRRPENVETPQ